MTKAEARAKARALWRQWDAAALRTMGGRMAHELFARPEWRQAGWVFCFVPMPGEPDLWPVLEAALREGKHLAVPRTANGRRSARLCAALATLRRGLTASANRSGAKFWRRRISPQTRWRWSPAWPPGPTACAWGAAAGIMTAFWRNIKAEACWCARPR